MNENHDDVDGHQNLCCSIGGKACHILMKNSYYKLLIQSDTGNMQVAEQVPGKTPQACEAFQGAFKSFLSLPLQFLNADVFWAVVKDKMKANDGKEEDAAQSEAKSEMTVTDTERDASHTVAPRRSSRTPKPQVKSHPEY